MDRDRAAVLARRARFVAAALAGVTPAFAARAESGEADRPPDDAGATEAEASPQICLSPDDIEGAERPCRDEPAHPDCAPPVRVPEMPPHVCLSIAPPSTNLEYQHDGFYLRIGPVGGLLGASAGDETTSGLAFGAELGAGMTLAPGVVVGLGGAFLRAPEPSESFESITLWQLGPLVTVYPSPLRGWRASLSVAPTVIAIRAPGEDASGVGIGGALWLGYDAFIAADWSLGLAGGAMLGFASAERSDGSAALRARALALSASLLWH